MSKQLSICSLILFLSLLLSTVQSADMNAEIPNQHPWVTACKDWDEWDKPGPPYQIYGNSYYVGTCGIAAILITGDDGHILIDGGTEAGADLIIENISALGYQINDVKLLLHSHEHFDHVAGLAKLQQLSGAKVLASEIAAPVLSTGITANNDPQAGMHAPFPSSRVDGIVDLSSKVRLGNLSLTPVSTPGHSPGALSWQWKSCDNEQCYSVVYADSVSPVSSKTYRFIDHPDYLAEYRKGLGRIAKLDCQVLVTPHPSASRMRDRLSTAGGLVDETGCNHYASRVSERLSDRIRREQSKPVK